MDFLKNKNKKRNCPFTQGESFYVLFGLHLYEEDGPRYARRTIISRQIDRPYIFTSYGHVTSGLIGPIPCSLISLGLYRQLWL